MKIVKKRAPAKVVQREVKSKTQGANNGGLTAICADQERRLLTTVSAVLDQIDDEDEYHPFAGQELANHRSLGWLADEIVKELYGYEEAYLDPNLNNSWEDYRLGKQCFEEIMANVYRVLSRRPQLKSDIKTFLDYHTKNTEQLYLTIGFAIGLRAAKRELESNLKQLPHTVLEKSTITPRDLNRTPTRKSNSSIHAVR